MMSPSFKDYVISVWQLLIGYRTRCEQGLAQERFCDTRPYLDWDSPLRILDLANGKLRPQYILLRSVKNQVYGIDLINAPTSKLSDRAYRLARWIYSLPVSPRNLSGSASTLACGDVGVLPFEDNYFDLITSIAAFEHFLDVPSVVAEMKRVMRPGGIAWIRIHLFTSPSGGHNVDFTEIPLRHLPKGVDPWDHLRKERLPPYAPLNKWRLAQYLEVFSQHFEILEHRCAMREGQCFLTPEIAAELNAYSRDELTCGAYVILVRKRS